MMQKTVDDEMKFDEGKNTYEAIDEHSKPFVTTAA